MTIDSVMRKAGFSSVDENIRHEEEIHKKYTGWVTERESPLKNLNRDEAIFLMNYLLKRGEGSQK